jgi:hypothetical protein
VKQKARATSPKIAYKYMGFFPRDKSKKELPFPVGLRKKT